MSEQTNINALSRGELEDMAEKLGIEGAADMANKGEIVEAINAHGGDEGELDTEGDAPAAPAKKKAKLRKGGGDMGHATGFDSTGNPTFS